MFKLFSKILCKPKTDILYIILPYFNFCKYKRRIELFIQFIKSIKNVEGICIVISEATLSGQKFQLPSGLPVFMHIKHTITNQLWIKENLINLAVKSLPIDWKYMAWIDADLTFINPLWVDDTIKALKDYDVIQMFSHCDNLDAKGGVMKVDRSFGYMYRESGRPYHKTSHYGFWHPGYAWACTRKAYEQMQGLVDFGILGSGDRHMALALIGLVEYSYPGTIHSNYAKLLKEYQDRCLSLRLGYINGKILHHWHGSLVDRRYVERWNILIKNAYDPILDIYKNDLGVISLTTSGKRLQRELEEYFIGRKEDKLVY